LSVCYFDVHCKPLKGLPCSLVMWHTQNDFGHVTHTKRFWSCDTHKTVLVMWHTQMVLVMWHTQNGFGHVTHTKRFLSCDTHKTVLVMWHTHKTVLVMWHTQNGFGHVTHTKRFWSCDTHKTVLVMWHTQNSLNEYQYLSILKYHKLGFDAPKGLVTRIYNFSKIYFFFCHMTRPQWSTFKW